KHHDGFALWPSPQSWNWNSMDIGPHKDLVGELSQAVRAKGLHMGLYFSLYEWYNPLYKTNLQQYVDEHMLPQVTDLVTRYKPDILWADGEWEHTSKEWKSPQFLSWLFNESPVKNNIVINDRWGSDTRVKHGGVYTTEYDLVFQENAKTKTITHPWEECRGIGGSFGYNRAEKSEDYASSQQLVHMLVEKVARGGNLLLDIGPTADGRIPVIMQQRLKDMGKWLLINGEAIYETDTWKDAPQITNQTTLFFTRKGKNLYAIATRFPDKPITLANIKAPEKVSLLGYNGKLKTSFKNNSLTIQPPAFTVSDNTSADAWVFKIENALN
ncbi:MAG: alpha-L-fucosidase, partial [Bacteroidetes bacterium]|nr:alpha-L-fucosidase [Bacteroidota bacterium]